MTDTVNIAVQGCCHGELDAVYRSLSEAEQRTGRKIDLLLLCGDVECIRCHADLDHMAVPPKYRHMNTFHEYLLGTKVAPVLTIFIGGNHEASNVLQDLYYGGYVAPKIFFLGFAGAVRYKGLRIAGLSGIYDAHHYQNAHFEVPPYSANALRSVYHTRNLDVQRLLQLHVTAAENPVDIFLSHDWPAGIARYGDCAQLLRTKPYFRAEIEQDTLGSPALRQLLQTLRPSLWFSAHLHVRFAAIVIHPQQQEEQQQQQLTRFLALDKVIPGRPFLHFLSIPQPRHPSASSDSSSMQDIYQRNAKGIYADDQLHWDVPFASIVRSCHYMNKAQLLPEELSASQPFCSVQLLRTVELLVRCYGPDLCIPAMQAVQQAQTLDAHLQARGNVQTDLLLQALQLQHLQPWTVPVPEQLAPCLHALFDRCQPGEQAAVAEVAAGAGTVEDPNAIDI